MVPTRTAKEAARFLTEVLVPEFAWVGWKLEWVLTDWGGEFKGKFDQACRNLGITRSRTKPRLDERVLWSDSSGRSSTSTGGWRSGKGTSTHAHQRQHSLALWFYNEERQHPEY